MDRREMLTGAIAAGLGYQAAQADATKAEIKSSQYVIVELMGYKKLCGRLSQGIAGLLQLDVPVQGGFVTQFINPASVYRITIVSEKTVREYATFVEPMPAIELEIPPKQQFLGYHDEMEF